MFGLLNPYRRRKIEKIHASWSAVSLKESDGEDDSLRLDESVFEITGMAHTKKRYAPLAIEFFENMKSDEAVRGIRSVADTHNKWMGSALQALTKIGSTEAFRTMVSMAKTDFSLRNQVIEALEFSSGEAIDKNDIAFTMAEEWMEIATTREVINRASSDEQNEQVLSFEKLDNTGLLPENRIIGKLADAYKEAVSQVADEGFYDKRRGIFKKLFLAPQ